MISAAATVIGSTRVARWTRGRLRVAHPVRVGVDHRCVKANNHALPFFEEHAVKVQTILSDNGREYCGRPDKHPYELFLQLEEIEHRTTKVGRPQSNGFIERFHRTLLEEHLRIKGRTTWYETVAEMQKDLDAYLETYNRQRPHRGRGMKGRTPYEVFKAGIPKKSRARKKKARKEVQTVA